MTCAHFWGLWPNSPGKKEEWNSSWHGGGHISLDTIPLERVKQFQQQLPNAPGWHRAASCCGCSSLPHSCCPKPELRTNHMSDWELLKWITENWSNNSQLLKWVTDAASLSHWDLLGPALCPHQGRGGSQLTWNCWGILCSVSLQLWDPETPPWQFPQPWWDCQGCG